MKKVIAVLLFASAAFAQGPLQLTEITNQANLGALLRWTAVPNARYNIYRNADYGCPAHATFDVIATGLTTTTYRDFPPLNTYCYAVSSVVDGAESAKVEADIFIGMKPYFTPAYKTPDCTSPAANLPTTPPEPPQVGTHLVLTQLREGVKSIVVDAVTGSPNNSRALIRLYDDATYTLTATLPDGKVMVYANPFGEGVPLSAISSNNLQFNIVYDPGKPDADSFCSLVEQDTLQRATSNHVTKREDQQ